MGATDIEPRYRRETTPMTGTVAGYDPGGDGKHGLARATVRDGSVVSVTTETLGTVEDVVASVLAIKDLSGVGIDTLTCWGTGSSGWRPADRWLRGRYPAVKKSIVAPNSLYGAMSVSGMALLVEVRTAFPDIYVTETHPKVLWYALRGQPYNYAEQTSVMHECLGDWLAVDASPQNEHEWDSAISILAVVHGLHGSWQHDLHARPTKRDERLVRPCGRTAYVWPEGRSVGSSSYQRSRRGY